MAIAPLQIPGYAGSGPADLYSPLAQLGQQLKANQMQAERKQTLADLGALNTPADFNAAALRLMQAGDAGGARTLADLGNNMADREWRREEATRAQRNADRTFGLQEKIATTKEEPEPIRLARAAGLRPGTPEYQQALFPKLGPDKLQAPDKKAIYESEDENVNLRSTIETLSRAKELAPKAFSGYSAGIRGSIGTNLPSVAARAPGWMGIDPESAKATTELNQLMSGEAITAMSQQLKGATTDREMNQFKLILADPNAPPELKLRTIERLHTLAQRKFDLNATRIKDLRGGAYFKPQGGGQGAPEAAPSATQSAPQAAQYTKGQRARNAQTGQTLEFDGQRWVPVQ